MIGNMQSMQSIAHCADMFKMAELAGLLHDSELVELQMKPLCEVYGIQQN